MKIQVNNVGIHKSRKLTARAGHARNEIMRLLGGWRFSDGGFFNAGPGKTFCGIEKDKCTTVTNQSSDPLLCCSTIAASSIVYIKELPTPIAIA